MVDVVVRVVQEFSQTFYAHLTISHEYFFLVSASHHTSFFGWRVRHVYFKTRNKWDSKLKKHDTRLGRIFVLFRSQTVLRAALWFLCLIKYLFMKTYEDMKVQRHISLISALVRVSDQLQASVDLPARKTSSTSWIGGCRSWPEGCEEGCWKRRRVESSLVEFSLPHQDATHSDGRHRSTRLDSAAVPAVTLKYLSLSEIRP
jgi:hypothetical protein